MDIFQLYELPPLDNLSYWPLDRNYFDIPVEETTFDALPLFQYEYDPLCSSLDIVPSQTLFQDDFLFGYENEFGFHPKKDQLMVCLEINVVENVEEPIIIISEKQGKRCRSSSKQKSDDPYSMKLSRNTISRYFHMPIKEAAKELSIGLTGLKNRCRELGISRWPHRKLKSLETVIENVQELDMEDGEGGGLSEAVNSLKQEIKSIEEAPDSKLGDKTKRLRQACFKAKYKNKKRLGLN